MLWREPNILRCSQLFWAVSKEADTPAAFLALGAYLRPVLGGVQVPLVHSVGVRALVSLFNKTPKNV